MGANYLLGVEEQEGRMLLLLKKKRREQTTHRPVSASGNNQSSSLHKHTWSWQFMWSCLLWENSGQELDFNGDISACGILYFCPFCGETTQAAAAAPPCGHSLTQQSSVKTTEELMFAAFITAPRLNHSILFTSSFQHRFPPQKTKLNICSSLNQKYT